MSIQTEMNSVLNELGIDGNCIRAEAHRHLAYYDIKLACKPAALGKLQRNTTAIALEIRSVTVPIVRLMPEEGIVRLQVALSKAQPIPFINLLHGERIPNPDQMVFPMLLGESEEGNKLWMDMNKNPHLLIAGSTGSGKALEINTPIVTPDGWKKIADLKCGDVVFDQYGNQTKVTATTGIMLNRTCYKVTFSDDSEIIADAQHEWVTLTAKDRAANSRINHRVQRNANRKSVAKTNDIKLIERMKKAAAAGIAKRGLKLEIEHSAKTTEQIKETLMAQPSNPRPNHSIRITNSLVLSSKELLIDPYVLGIWLGDGESAGGRITTNDPEIVFQISHHFTIKKGSGKYGWGCYFLKGELREIGVLKNKHIPNDYLRADKQQRLALLQGLMDSDGTVSNVGACVFSNTNKRLIDGVVELARSLGFFVSINKGYAKLNGRIISDNWNVSIIASEPLFRITRKLQRQSLNHTYGKHVFIVKIEPIDSVPVCCISTEAKTYLCGERMIPTHNSTLAHTIVANGLMLHAMRARNVQIYLNDPKRIEFQEYGSSDLSDVVKEIACSYSETLSQLEYLAAVMDDRYVQMGEIGMRSVEENPQHLPLVLCIVDEVADLMIQDKGHKLEAVIVKLAQKGRAAGIFMVLATQRPSVNVITGLIKANFPGRIACKTASKVDSMVILDRVGAETLLGRGDAVLKNQQFESLRFQVAQTSPATNKLIFSTLRKPYV